MKNKFLITLIIIILGLCGILLSSQIKSKMDQKLFITHDNIQSLTAYHKEFGSNNNLLLSINEGNLEKKIIDILGRGIKIPTINDHNSLQSSHVLIPLDTDSNKHELLIKEIEELESTLNLHFPRWSLAGPSWTNYNLAVQNKAIQEKIFPLVFLLIAFLYYFVTKNLKISLFNFIISLSCTGYSFWWLKIIKDEVHILTNLIPLLNFVLPSTITLHFIYSLLHHGSWSQFWKEKKIPILLTSLTTLAGFGSLYFSSIQAIKDFAILSTLTLSLSFFLTVILLFLNSNNIHLWIVNSKLKSNFKMPTLSIPLKSKYSFGLGAFCLFCIFAGWAILPKLPILVEAEKFFSKNHPVSLGLENAKHALGGIPIAEIVIEKKANLPLTFTEFKNMDSLLTKVESDFTNLKFMSPQVLIKIANKQYTASYSLPDFELSAKTLYSQIPTELKGNSWQENKIKLSILGTPSPESSASVDLIVSKINEILNSNYNVYPTGEVYFIGKSQSNLVVSLLQSFAMSFMFSTLIVMYFLRSIRKIFNFVLVNLAPVSLTLLCFPLFNMQINMATVMSFSISFGLIVDGTIHLQFLNEFNQNRVKIPILLSSLCILLAFLPLSFYNFVPIWQFSLCFCITLFLGLIFDLLILENL